MKNQSEEYKLKMKERLDKAFKKEERSLVGFFIKNHRFTYLILFAIIAMGFFSLMSLPREANPEVKVPFASVLTILPGATPLDMEELVTKEIEDAIKNVDNLKRFTSSSGEGVSSVFVEFDANADMDDSYRKLREAVNRAKPSLPSEAEDPMTAEISFSDFPIVTYSLVGDISDVELKELADIIQKEFEGIKSVSKVPVMGGLTREYQVIVDQTKLANFNTSLSQVVSAISRSNFNLPAGNIEIDGFKYNVRVEGKFKDVEAVKDVVIATYSETPIYVKDVAHVIDGFKDRNTLSRIGFSGEPSRNTISLQIFKKTGGNILEIGDQAQIKVEELQKNGTIPDYIDIIKTNDNSVWIRDDLSRLGKSGLQTMILIVLILLIVLSFRGAFITGLSVPIAFLMSFIILNLLGQTLNSLVLFSLVLSLGLMVDNSIVIIEGINEYIKYGRNVYQAAILSVWNFKWPIIAGTMTTVCAFLPILLVSGILGEFMAVMPITIAATLISSLFVAIIVIPTLIYRFLKLKVTAGKSDRDQKRHHHVRNVRAAFTRRYVAILNAVLPHKKKRRLLLGAVWVLFLIAVAIPASGIMKIEMFGVVDVDYFVVNIKTPIGTNIDKTNKITREVETIIASIEEVDNYVTNVGTSQSVGMTEDSSFGGSGSDSAHLANITANFVDASERKRKSYEITETIRPALALIQGAEVTAEEIGAGPPTGAPIEVRMYGDELDTLTRLSERVEHYLNGVEGVINIKDSIQESTGDFTFKVNKQQADFHGLNTMTIASNIRTAVYGSNASVVNVDGDDIDVTVKYDDASFKSVEDLNNILLFTPKGENIKLKQVADLDIKPSLLSIGHRDGKKVVTISADVEDGVNLKKVLAGFDEFQKEIAIPSGYTIEVGGEVEDIEQSFKELFLSMIVSIILISIILVLQFNSFKQPLIIIFALPLAVIGVIFGLNLLFMPFSFTVFIGIVALSGIVVNDAIVLIDRINKNLRYGMSLIDGILEGGQARMQPIFLTTLTTVAGIFPLIFADELWRGLAITIIFGLIFATFLTLVVVPVMYYGMCGKECAEPDMKG